MTAALAAALALANWLDSTEGPRVRAPLVYAGTVAEVRKVGSLGAVAGSQGSRMEATFQDVKVLRGSPPPPAATGTVRYDQWDPPYDGGLQYRLAVGEKAVVFTRSLDKEYPIAMVNGTAKVVGDHVRARRQQLADMDADALKAQGLTEAQRPEQVQLYDRALAALGLK